MALLTLPLVLAIIMVELAIGGAFLLWYLDRTEDAPSGFLKLTAFVDAGAIAFAGVLLPAIPHRSGAADAHLDPDRLATFSQLVIVVIVLVVAQLVASFFPWKGARQLVGAVTVLAGVVCLSFAALARPGTVSADALALLALPLGALALGGSDAAMLLGHWYLVTPKLSTGPLRRAALVVVFAVGLQLVIALLAIARGQLSMEWEPALLVAVALRIGVGIFGTGAVALAAWWTARMNTQASTGLLYVGIGTAISGEISAKVLFFLTGVAL
ncbi:MAG TPA: hypothetical protein VIN34_10995 [Candidatus Limnocylindria bacterium]